MSEEYDDSNGNDSHSHSSKHSNRTTTTASVNNNTITLDALSNKRNRIVIPAHHIIIDKRLLTSIVSDYHKSSEILHKVFSPKVIDELSRGDGVKAEEFDSVTIFFSDIVGIIEHHKLPILYNCKYYSSLISL